MSPESYCVVTDGASGEVEICCLLRSVVGV
jgi:hypothetical protein